MTLQDLGYSEYFENLRIKNNSQSFEIGRIISEHKERYIISKNDGESIAEITGNMRYSAKCREDFPAVGDWVAISVYDDLSIIHQIIPRKSALSRKAVGQFGEVQIIAANVDVAFLVQAVDRDFNINRIERYLAICYSSKVIPIIVLSKIDLISELQLVELKKSIHERINDVPVIPIDNLTKQGIDSIKNVIQKGKTYCVLGSSGVGKSSLINVLSGKETMKTGEISLSTNKGKHVTSHRELIVLDQGGILIDNPGMREIGVSGSNDGVEAVFDSIAELSEQCKFKDCTHTIETGCSVLNAIENGQLDKNTYINYLKIEKERAYFESSLIKKKKKDKTLGKIVKEYYYRNPNGKMK